MKDAASELEKRADGEFDDGQWKRRGNGSPRPPPKRGRVRDDGRVEDRFHGDDLRQHLGAVGSMMTLLTYDYQLC